LTALITHQSPITSGRSICRGVRGVRGVSSPLIRAGLCNSHLPSGLSAKNRFGMAVAFGLHEPLFIL
jgi:hypothetical protein